MACSHYYPTPGGTERQAHQLARALRARGHDVHVLTMRLERGPTCMSIEGVPVRRAIRGIERGALFGVSYLLSAFIALLRFGRRADVLHAHHLYLDAAAVAAAGPALRASTLAKVACGGSGGDLSRLRRSRAGGILLRAVRRLDRVVAPSRETEAEMREVGFLSRQVVRIPNGVDVHRFAPGRPVASREGRTVLFLGRLDRQKGVDTLIQAWAEVSNCLPQARLAIGGAGPEETNLQALVAAAGLGDRVRFLGVVPDPERYLREAAAFVLPSWFEGIPNALLEAMASGVPCIATAIPGTMDVATDGEEALLVSPGDPPALAAALRRILTDDEAAARLAVSARRRVVAEFSLDALATRYEQLYLEMRDAA